jgi:maltose O-acetyltransferase
MNLRGAVVRSASKLALLLFFRIRYYFYQIHSLGLVQLYQHVHPSVRLGATVSIVGPRDKLRIGRGTYVNGAQITVGHIGTVCIGERCAVGYRVSIKAVTHDVRRPAPDHEGRVTAIEKPISIGDRCWIGDGVFIREGVRLGDDVIVAANSVVTKSFESGSVIAGVPARKIRGAVIQ